MALDQSALLEVLDALKVADVGDRVRPAAETIYQALIEAELTERSAPALHERTDDRTAQRNGHRTRTLTTTAGDLELRIPKLRTGSFFPSLLERRRRVDQALFAVVMEAYLHGVSTRKVDDLVKALGADTGISKSEVSRICADLDTEVGAFRDRSPGRAAVPLRVPRRDLLQGPGQPPGRVPGRRDRHRRPRRRLARGPRVRRRRQRGRRVLDRVPALASRPAAWAGCSWSSPTPTPGSSRPSPRCCSARPGSGAGCISCATSWPRSPRAPRRWSPRRSARSSPNPTPRTSATSST